MSYYYTNDLANRLRFHNKPECLVVVRLEGLHKLHYNAVPGCPQPLRPGDQHLCAACGKVINPNPQKKKTD